jgi:hypothetical protein
MHVSVFAVVGVADADAGVGVGVALVVVDVGGLPGPHLRAILSVLLLFSPVVFQGRLCRGVLDLLVHTGVQPLF